VLVLERLDGLQPVDGGDHVVPVPAQRQLRGLADHRVVLDHQDPGCAVLLGHSATTPS
jgi:hypothetical protein